MNVEHQTAIQLNYFRLDTSLLKDISIFLLIRKQYIENAGGQPPDWDSTIAGFLCQILVFHIVNLEPLPNTQSSPLCIHTAAYCDC